MAATAQLFCMIRLRDIGAGYGYAVPFGLGKKADMDGICVFDSFIFAGTQSCGVPISRGSPPTSE